MMGSRRGRIALALAVAAGVAGCASSGGSRGEASGGTGSLSAEQMEEIYLARVDSARMRYTEADVRFMTGMIHHHAQAIEMSALAPDHTANPRIHTLARRITNAQRDEIATMRRWLHDRDLPAPPPMEEMAAHAAMGHAQMQGMSMPGMLTPEQMQSLRQARGDAFDRLFLTLMIQHHRGAMSMVKELFATDGAGQDEEVFKFASDVQVDQATEVARMEGMLSALQLDAVP